MADTKITALTALTGADPANDVIPIVDVSDTTMAASGTTKKISVNNILGASGTATLASATITGYLTVGSDLSLNGNENYVYLFSNYSIGNNSRVRFRAVGAGGGSGYGGDFRVSTRASNNTWNTDVLTIDSSANCIWTDGAGGTRMTLNSTGLGVGVSPAVKLDIGGAATQQFRIQMSGQADTRVISDTGAGIIGTYSNHRLVIRTNSADAVTVDASQNVGIGVTPSAWGSNSKALQVGNGSGAVSSTGAGITFTRFTHGCYFDNTNWKYQFTGVGPSLYELTGANAGSTHAWYVSAGGTAGNNITFTQAMTLDAVSSLHVNTTAYIGVAAGFVNALNGYNIVQNNTGSASNRNWQLATNGSSAGTLDFTISSANNTFPNFAYRMQLTSAGAAYNTTGTWGTISDSRLKENISDARNYLADLLKLRVVKYSLKEEASAVATKLGLIAQEVEQVFPSLVEQSDVAYDGGDGIRTVKTSILVPMLLKAIQELTARVQTLETR